MARPSKLTPELLKKIVKALENGVTDVRACEFVGIAPSTFYDWIKLGEALDDDGNPVNPQFAEFSEAVSRARATANVQAVKTLRAAMNPYTEVSTRTYSETRVNEVTGEPYDYSEVTTTKTKRQGDWRAALEYLRRRDKLEWGDNVDVTSDHQPVNINIIEVAERTAPPTRPAPPNDSAGT